MNYYPNYVPSKKLIEFWEYLGVNPLSDYWYADLERKVWVISGKGEKPIRPEDLTEKGRREMFG